LNHDGLQRHIGHELLFFLRFVIIVIIIIIIE